MPAALPNMQRLIDIMARLRDKQSGCPWDIEQSFATIAPYTIEEAYEVADAIDKGDMGELKQELGDLLLQVVFHAQMAQEQSLFDFESVAQSIADKMITRHPHVFGDQMIESAEAQTANWENIKEQERKAKQSDSILADIPAALPALMRAIKLQNRAARVGFDWPDSEQVYEKLAEELQEVRDAGDNQANRTEEIGDLLFVVANLARHLKVDPEDALRAANRKFERRFQYIEQQMRMQGRSLEGSTLDEMEALWSEAKHKEKAA